jgi:hypothetical protein
MLSREGTTDGSREISPVTLRRGITCGDDSGQVQGPMDTGEYIDSPSLALDLQGAVGKSYQSEVDGIDT